MKLKEFVALRSYVDGDCRIWSSAMSRNNRPIANYTNDGKRIWVDLQLHLARKKFDLPEGKKISIRTTCGNPRCIAMAHIELANNVGGSIKGRLRTGSKCANAEHNMQVFKLLVTNAVVHIAGLSKLGRKTVDRILRNKAMLPYFQLCIQWHTGVDVLTLRGKGLSDVELKEQYGLSKQAIDFIQGDEHFRIVDEDVYVKMLSQCDVLGDHLVWTGDYINDGPVVKTLSGRTESVGRVFYAATTGVVKERKPFCNCGRADCVNPFHLE